MKMRVECFLLALMILCGCAACAQGDAPESSMPSTGTAAGSDDAVTTTDTVATTSTTATATETMNTTTESSMGAANTTSTTTTSTTKNTTTTTGKPEKQSVQKWMAAEIDFASTVEYKTPVYDAEMDVVFTHKKTGKTLTIPAFWDGGTTWKVRFALTEIGEWSWKTSCSDKENKGLHGKSGNVTCVAYTGKLDIYKHGFLKTETGKPYFMYDDGTPFFYLGDTHWTLPMEELDGIGDIDKAIAAEKGITSQFEYIMDYRAKQGYTVIQSQQLDMYNGISGNSWMGDGSNTIFRYGVNKLILEKFQTLDRYFEYIAKLGFVHSHTQFSYPEELIGDWLGATAFGEKELKALCRYWVARYCAYPVMWATTQEGDRDYYSWGGCTPETNPWKLVLEYVAQYDPYDHPSTCHQENTGRTQVNNSAFKDLPSHSWYASQWSFDYSDGSYLGWSMLKEYWNNPGRKPVVNYEGRYDHFWTGSFGARSQGWAAFMNGQFGMGYGAQPIWSLSWAPGPTYTDGIEEYNPELNWLEGLELEVGDQLIFMKKFLEEFEWWRLEPCFDGNDYYAPGAATNYSVSTIGNDVYLGYFYGQSRVSMGTLKGMQNGEYTAQWMNCRTGLYSKKATITVTDGTWKISGKPDSGDCALVVKKVK